MDDALVVGSGPNGLAAAIALAQQGRSVRVVEAADTVGGGSRSAELTLPGFVHDVCSAVHPMAVASPFFRTLPLANHGLEWVHPDVPFAQPLDGGTAAALHRDVNATAEALGEDARAYRRLMEPLARNADSLFGDLLGPFGRIPRGPLTALRFGLRAIRSGVGLANAWFRGTPAQALIAGLAAHAVIPLEQSPSAAIAVMLGLAGHAVGWPFPRGGARKIADALASYFRSLGGVIETNRTVTSVDELQARVILLDVTPRQVLALAGHKFHARYRRAMARYRYGPGVFKVDWALSGPIPWRAAECRRAGTVHVGGTLEEVAAAERAPWRNEYTERPFVLLAQPTLFDPTRAPEGKHVAWGYCHVPHGSTVDMTERIEAQIERFAPGFRDLILARHTMTTAAMERYNANYIGGDIAGGVTDWWQLFTRPVMRLNPYTTPARNIFICSSSTPPGGGVHGMCGYFAARAAARRL